MKTITQTALLLLLLWSATSCNLWERRTTVANTYEIFGKVGFAEGLIALESNRGYFLPITEAEKDALTQGDTLTIRYNPDENRDNLSVKLCFVLRDVHDNHPNYLKNFDVTGYKKRRSSLDRIYEVYCAKDIDLCMAKVEKVEITSNYAFGEAYPVGKDLTPLSMFIVDSFEEYIQNNFQPQGKASLPMQKHKIKGDDADAWKQRRLYDSRFDFKIPKPTAKLEKDKELTFTFTFHLVDKLKSDTARKTLKRTIRLKMEPHKQA